jgi:hypothetical protein
MAIWDAAGPCAIVCSTPSTVVAVTDAMKFCGTPCQTRKSVMTIESGSST